jgi:hypothetical protein
MPVTPLPPVMMTDVLLPPSSSTRHDDVVDSSSVRIMTWPVLDYVQQRLHPSRMIASIGSSLMIYVYPTVLETTSL